MTAVRRQRLTVRCVLLQYDANAKDTQQLDEAFTTHSKGHFLRLN